MARLVLVLLIVAEIVMVQAGADEESRLNPVGVEPSEETDAAEPAPAAASADVSDTESSDHYKSKAAAEAPESGKLARHPRKSPDMSVAGGGVIIGGLVTAAFAAVICYIRVTRKRNDLPATANQLRVAQEIV